MNLTYAVIEYSFVSLFLTFHCILLMNHSGRLKAIVKTKKNGHKKA